MFISTLLLAPAALAFAQEPDSGTMPRLYTEHGDAVRKMDEHITFLSNAYLGGRLPGTPGMHITERYVEEHFLAAGLEPAFDNGSSFRQSVPLPGARTLGEHALTVGSWKGQSGKNFGISLSGSSGDVTAELVFAGYSVQEGPNGYSSYSGENDLEGKIAVIFRFEPMDETGRTTWGENGRWTNAAGFTPKLQAAEAQGAVGIILVNPPGVDDPRAGEIPTGRQNRQRVSIPVAAVTTTALDRMLEAGRLNATSMQLREGADKQGGVLPLGMQASLKAVISQEQRTADNIGGLLRGRGALADEIVVVGGHIDHLGMGVYGSRRGRGELHPGADDNASGTAAVIMLADRLVPWMNSLPAGTPARSILFLGLNAEEAGLDGARHYVDNPIAPIETHTLMINFDMIGRVAGKRLQILGSQTGEGLKEWLTELDEQSPLVLNAHDRLNLGSDHIPFIGKQVPALFAIIDPLHADYHTPDDVAWKINRVDAVHVVDLFEAILQGGALRPERHTFLDPRASR
jgi:Zn-dependent M28 family amino/carboxypeptidase